MSWKRMRCKTKCRVDVIALAICPTAHLKRTRRLLAGHRLARLSEARFARANALLPVIELLNDFRARPWVTAAEYC